LFSLFLETYKHFQRNEVVRSPTYEILVNDPCHIFIQEQGVPGFVITNSQGSHILHTSVNKIPTLQCL
jgi:hypothetical protein